MLPSGATTLVFVNTEDSLAAENATNRLWVNVPDSDPDPAKCWKDLGAPGPTPPQVRFSPAAVLAPGWPAPHFGRVFVVAGDGKLYSRAVRSTGDVEGAWSAHGSPPGVTALSSPAFVTLTANDDMLVFINGDGVMHRFVLRLSGVSEWTSLKQRGAQFTAVSRPFAQPYGAGDDAKVFVFGREQVTEEWRLFECDAGTPVNNEFLWIDHGAPPSGATVSERPEAHAPAGFLERPDEAIDIEGKHIFLRGADNHLYELLDPEEPGEEARWVDRSRRGRPSQKDDPPLRDSPAVHVAPGPPISIRLIAASVDNSLVAWEFEIRVDMISTPADVVGFAIRLTDSASDADDAYLNGSLEVVSGPGGPAGPRTVEAYDGPLRLVRFTPDFNVLPNSTSEIEIDGQSVGNALDGTDELYALHPRPSDTRRANLLELRWNEDIVATDFYSRLCGVVSIPGPTPTGGDVVLYSELLNVTSEYLPLEDRSTAPNLSWEYWNGRGWLSLGVIDKHRATCSRAETSPSRCRRRSSGPRWRAGQLLDSRAARRRRLRPRDVQGREQRGRLREEHLRPPKITQLRIVYKTPPVPPAVALTFNNLDYLDQTAACHETGAHFQPFERLETVPGGR